MLVAANAGVGSAVASPDVCLTPDGTGGSQAIPYVNTANNAQATGAVSSVLISMVPALNTGSSIPSTTGDEAGTNSAHQGKATFTAGDPVVQISGMPAVALASPTAQNGTNAVGAVTVPSLTTVTYNLRSGERVLGMADLEVLHDVLRGRAEVHARLLEGGVGLAAIPLITATLSAELHGALRVLAMDGLRALVLDLRGCPGGDLDAAIDAAGAFLPEDTVIARVVDHAGDAVTHRSRALRPYDLPLVALVDDRTASAAELFVGALSANDRAVVVGERTYGKGAVQAVVPAVGGFVANTLGYVSLPGDVCIEGAGISPDLQIASDEGDPQLDAALALALAMA